MTNRNTVLYSSGVDPDTDPDPNTNKKNSDPDPGISGYEINLK